MTHRSSTKFATAGVLAIVSLTAVLAACSKHEEPAATSAPPPAAATPAAPPPAETPEDQKMANAVVTGKTAAAVDLKYDVLAKPAVGTAFEVELAFLPRLPADVLEVEVTGIPGLTVVSGGTSRFEGVNPGDRYPMKVLVRADEPGLYYVGVAAKMSTKVQTDARTFSVPLVVGSPHAAEKPAPATDASGQPIESMPAAESSPAPEAAQPQR